MDGPIDKVAEVESRSATTTAEASSSSGSEAERSSLRTDEQLKSAVDDQGLYRSASEYCQTTSMSSIAPQVDERFDASQYAFFGRDVSQEIEIGGLDEEDDTELEVQDDVDETFSLSEKELGDTYRSSSDLGDVSELSSSFLKFNRITSRSEVETGSTGSSEGGGHSNSKEAAAVRSQSFEPPPTSGWLDNVNQDTKSDLAAKWWSNNDRQSTPVAEADSLLGPSHQVQQQHEQQWWGLNLSSAQTVPHVPTPGALYSMQRGQQAVQGPSPVQVQMIRAQGGLGSTVPVTGQYRHPYPNLLPSMGAVASMTPYGASLAPQYSSSGPVMTPLAPPVQWLPQSNVQLGSVSGSGTQHTPLMSPQVVLQYQHLRAPQLQTVPTPPYPSHLKPQHMYHVTPQAPQMVPKIGESVAAGDSRDHSHNRSRQTQRHHQHGLADGNFSGRNTHYNNGWQPLRSKYMTVEEIENIVRIQWAATHSSDPYVDDYYHQAVQTKLSAGSPQGRRHFAPSHLRDLPSHTRAAVEPHAYLQVDALGRVPFSSIRRPRPLLEVDSATGSTGLSNLGQGESLVDGVPQHKPLEQEPMLAARIAIEDGLCLLLDVDDIDRLLAISQPPDGGAQLRRRRQLLLEGLAASLQLVDTNGADASGHGMNGRFMGMISKDDLVFLRLASLPKGRKLLTRYLHLLTPGSELVRIATMAVFRHLRFLFGAVQSDPSTLATTVGLANAAAMSVLSMDLPALCSCLAAVVLAPEQPPLRPMGSPAGDGATVVLRAVLERATSLLIDRNASYPMQNRAVWQASFDAFFALLAKYCTNKYDSIFHSLMMASPGNPAAINTAAAVAMSKEMPVELLRASLPHTNDHQRKLLLEFAQRSMAMGFPSNTGNEGHANVAAVRG